MAFEYKKHSTHYSKLFEEMKRKILELYGRKLEIEHIGSTAVPGLGGKGIIDISIGIKRWQEVEEIIEILKKLGFEHFHNIENGNLFVSTKEKCEEGDFHIHISRVGTKRYKDTLVFRDYLINHPEEAKKYGELKKELFNKCVGDRKLYKKLKSEYFADLEKTIGANKQ